MLKALSIENIAVAKKLNMDFFGGFTVLTGQTGTGKSVIVDSIELILGGKVQREAVRYGEASGRVSALFDGVKNTEPFDENGEAYFDRTFTPDGKSTAKINGKSVTQSYLKDVSTSLLTLHSQNSTASLYEKDRFIGLLDGYAGCSEMTAEYGVIYEKLVSKRSEIADLKKSLKDKEMMTDILKYQLSEIEKAKISDVHEEEKLERLRLKLKSIEVVSKNANLVRRALMPSENGASAAYLLERAAAALRKLSDVMEEAEDLAQRLLEYRIDIIDIAERAGEIIDGDDISDPDKKLDIIESRLAQFSKLKKKYGGDLESVLAFGDDVKRKLTDLQSGDEKVEELELEYRDIEKEALAAARKIGEIRRIAAKKLSDEVMKTLKFLDMPRVMFFADVRKTPEGTEKFNRYGIDTVEFTVVTNPGEEAQPLYKIASGGEMSRIMLAIKCAEAENSGAQTVVFDEIDTGVSGGTAEKIGMKLKELSKKTQVICVTHSAQVAAHADRHLLIEKKEIDGRAESFVRELSGEERVAELARIIGGINVTEKQYSAARDLLNNK